jgi:hypothetical protein
MTTNTGTIQFGTTTGTNETYEILTASSSSDLKITATGKLTLKAPENINIDGSLDVGTGSITGGSLSATGSIQGASLDVTTGEIKSTGNLSISTVNTDTTITLTAQGNFSLGLGTISGTNNIDIYQNNGIYIDASNEDLSLHANNLYLNSSTNSIKFQNAGTTFGTFTSKTLDNSGTTSDLSITSGNTSDNSGNIFLNALKKSGTAGAGDIAIGIGIGTIGNNLGIFIDDTGLLHLESKNGYKISTGGSVELESTNSNVTIDASTNILLNLLNSQGSITLAPGDDGIIVRGNNNGGTVGSFKYYASNFYINADNDLFLNTGSSKSIYLQNNGTQFGTFSGSSSGDLTINANLNMYLEPANAVYLNTNSSGNAGSNVILENNGTQFGTFTVKGSNNLTIAGTGGNVYIENNLTVGSIGGGTITAGGGTIGGSTIVTQNTLVTTLSNFTHPISASSISAGSGSIGGSSIVTQNTLDGIFQSSNQAGGYATVTFPGSQTESNTTGIITTAFHPTMVFFSLDDSANHPNITYAIWFIISENGFRITARTNGNSISSNPTNIKVYWLAIGF